MKSPHRGREWRRSGRVHATTNVEMGTHASDALRFLALLAHGPRFGAHKERAEDNATTQLTKRQSPQLAVGHEDDITCFTIVPRILYAPLPMLFDVCFAFPLRSLSLSFSRELANWLVDIGICRCRVMKYSRPFSLLFFHRLPLHRCPYFATSSSCFSLFRLLREGKGREVNALSV